MVITAESPGISVCQPLDLDLDVAPDLDGALMARIMQWSPVKSVGHRSDMIVSTPAQARLGVNEPVTAGRKKKIQQKWRNL